MKPRARNLAAHAMPTTRSAILSHYAQVSAPLNIDIPAMLRRVGLDALCLVDPNMEIPAIRAVELIERSAIEARCPVFGVRLALARGVPDLGPLTLLLREEPDLRSALRSLHSYLHLHNRSVRFALQEEAGVAVLAVGFTIRSPLPFAAPQSMEMILCGVMQSIRWLIGSRWSPNYISISHPGPEQVRTHRSLFGCPVRFEQEFDGIVMPRSDLSRPISSSSPIARKYAEDYIKSLSTISRDFHQDVTALIATLLPTGRCSASAVARRLGMDRSTLSRRLAAQRDSYSALLQGTRMTLASRSCLSGVPLTEVAQQLGFADLSVFSRWFSRSFGCSASAWRRRQLRAG